MSDVFNVQVKNAVSPALREISHISMSGDIGPAMRHAMGIVEDALRGVITDNGRGYDLSAHAQKGVKSKPWTVSTTSRTFGFTTYLSAREWLYIFNGGTYKTGIRRTKKPYTTSAYTDRLGRHVPQRRYSSGVDRGRIPALQFMDDTRRLVGNSIFSMLRDDIVRAVNERLQQKLS